MPHARSRIAVLTLTLLVAACEKEPTPIAPRDAPVEPTDLEVSIPQVHQALFVDREGDATPAPRRSIESPDEYAPDDLPFYEMPDELPRFTLIKRANTISGMDDHQAWASGMHTYEGNAAHIMTKVRVMSEYEVLGESIAEDQEYEEMFPFGFFQDGWIAKTAVVGIFDSCGLHIEGDSKHEAWWEFYLGTQVATWGRTHTTTRSQPLFQPPCEEEEETTSIVSGGYPEELALCYYYLEYDLNSGEIYEMEFLFCTDVEGGFA